MSAEQLQLIHLGTFEVTDDLLRISDPCYDRNTWCAGTIKNPKQGTWNAYIAEGDGGVFGGRRPWELIAIHSSFPISLREEMMENSGIDVGVDSGQAGIFSESGFHGGEDHYGEDGWYDTCCAITSTEHSAGLVQGGCVSMSGWGDGSYECFLVRDGLAEVVGAKIVFIWDEEE